MRIGLSTANFFPEYNTEDMITRYGEWGVTSVEVFLNTFSEMRPEFIRLLRDRCEAHGIAVHSVHVMSAVMEPCLFDLLERRRQDFLAIFRETLQCVRGLGADIYTFHGPPLYMAEPSFHDHLARCYDELYELAEAAGVRLAQENVGYLPSGQPEFIRAMKDRMNHRMLHTFDIKQAVRAGVDPFAYLELVGPDLVNVHLNDHDRDHSCLLPGAGSFDFPRLFGQLKDLGYQGNAILELYRHNFQDERDLLEACRRLADQWDSHVGI